MALNNFSEVTSRSFQELVQLISAKTGKASEFRPGLIAIVAPEMNQQPLCLQYLEKPGCRTCR